MSKFWIQCDGENYYTDSVEEFIRSDAYRGQSLQIEMAPEDGRYDENGRRIGWSLFAPNGRGGVERLPKSVPCVLGSWEYMPNHDMTTQLSLSDLTAMPFFNKERILSMNGELMVTKWNLGGYSAEVRFNRTGLDLHEVTTWTKQWKHVISVL